MDGHFQTGNFIQITKVLSLSSTLISSKLISSCYNRYWLRREISWNWIDFPFLGLLFSILRGKSTDSGSKICYQRYLEPIGDHWGIKLARRWYLWFEFTKYVENYFITHLTIALPKGQIFVINPSNSCAFGVFGWPLNPGPYSLVCLVMGICRLWCFSFRNRWEGIAGGACHTSNCT